MSLVPFFGRGHLSGFGDITATGTITAAVVNATTSIDTPALTVDSIDDSGAAAISIKEHAEWAASKQCRADPGTVGAPGFAYVGRTGVGFYSDSAASHRAVIGGGVYSALFQSGNVSINGSLTTPLLVWTERTDFSSSANVAVAYARDAASKTELVVRAGAAVTEAILVTEA